MADTKIENKGDGYTKDMRAFVCKMRSGKSVYTIANDDYKWQPGYQTINTENGANPPKIIVREQQTVEMFDWRAVSDGIISAVGNLASGSKSIPAGKGIGVAIDALAPIAGEGLKQLSDKLLRNEKTCKNGFDVATKYIDRIVEYSTIKIFELPYYETYMFSSGGGQWSSNGDNAGPIDKLKTQTFSINTPMPPSWKGTSTDEKDYRTSFNLINFTTMQNSTDQLVKNYKFMVDLIAGSYWMQVYLFQRSSNLYSVECPGRFFIPFAQMHVDIKYYGKTRTNESAVKLLQEAGILEGYNYLDILFPDMYEIDVSFKSMSPNNFNTFVQSQSKTSIVTNNQLDEKSYEANIEKYHERMTSASLYTFGVVEGDGAK